MLKPNDPKTGKTNSSKSSTSKPKAAKSNQGGVLLKRAPAAQLNAALYARVSTHEQQTLPMQLKQMRGYATKRGWKISHNIEEIGSGAKTLPQREEISPVKLLPANG